MPPTSLAERSARAAGVGEWATYRLYGMTLSSDFAFSNRLAPGAGPPELTFICVRSAPLAGSWERVEPDYASPPGNDGGSSILVYRLGESSDECWVVRFRTADFYLWPGHIICHLLDPRHGYLAEIQLLGIVLALWLERRGVPALHASAVAVRDRAAAFLSTAGSGKSSLAMTLMQAGYPLLTDDILPVERSGGAYSGHPGYPQVRVWPEQARSFFGHHEGLDIVHPSYSKRRFPVGYGDGFGDFCEASRPLGCLYLPERRDPAIWGTRVEITAVSPLQSMMYLIAHSFAGRVVEALTMQTRRMSFFASLVGQVPVRRLLYPDGYHHLPEVRRAILADLDSLSAGEGG